MPDYNYYSEETQEIMGTIPGRFVRWGITIIGVVFAGIIVASYFIRYPETIQAPVVVSLVGRKVDDAVKVSFADSAEAIVRDSSCMTGRAYLPSKGFGKVALDQTVYVSLDCFPDMEFGKLKGKISKICTHLQKDKYVVEIDFSDNATTTYGRKLTFLSEMNGKCEVITQNKRLIDCLIEPIRQLFGE